MRSVRCGTSNNNAFYIRPMAKKSRHTFGPVRSDAFCKLDSKLYMDTAYLACKGKEPNGISWLISLHRKYPDPDQFVNVLLATINDTSPTTKDLEEVIGGIRGAVSAYMAERGISGFQERCAFCGKTSSEVDTLMVSAESAICDQCAVSTLKTLCRKPGQRFLRFAYTIFEFIVHIRYWNRRPFRW
jgi:hypothetical protein